MEWINTWWNSTPPPPPPVIDYDYLDWKYVVLTIIAGLVICKIISYLYFSNNNHPTTGSKHTTSKYKMRLNKENDKENDQENDQENDKENDKENDQQNDQENNQENDKENDKENDQENDQLLNIGLLKELSGDDTIQVRQLYREVVDIKSPSIKFLADEKEQDISQMIEKLEKQIIEENTYQKHTIDEVANKDVPEVVEGVSKVNEDILEVVNDAPEANEDAPEVVEDAPEVVEDVPAEVVEDVPEVVEDVPAEVVEDVPAEVVEDVPEVSEVENESESIEDKIVVKDKASKSKSGKRKKRKKHKSRKRRTKHKDE